MMEHYMGMPPLTGKYRCAFLDPKTGRLDDIREIWLFPEECFKEPFTEDDRPLAMDYTPLPGSTVAEWKKKPLDDAGVINLMCAIVHRAKLDAFSANPKLRETAHWFLNTYNGRQWLKNEHLWRNSDEYVAWYEKNKLMNKEKYKRRKAREQAKKENK